MKRRFRLVLYFHFFLIALSTNGWITFKNVARLRGGNLFGSSKDTPFEFTSSEVVGAFGRMGSFWLCHQECENIKAYAVPRGLSPGCLSPIGSPIFVATPTASWQEIFDQTLPNRREDLIFCGNGLPTDAFSEATVLVPHFAVLNICRHNATERPIRTNAMAPHTFVYGKHAKYASKILNFHSVSTKIVDSFAQIKQLAAQKLLWASCMWLVCHAVGPKAITVKEVHEHHQSILDRLLDEITPSLEKVVGDSVDRNELDTYLKAYSLSIADAIPSIALAKAELDDRNGVWLRFKSEEHPQVLHQTLIKQVLGKDSMKIRSQRDKNEPPTLDESKAETMDLSEVGLMLSARKIDYPGIQLKQISIVGGGIIGSSVAFFLAYRRPDLNITVIDLLSENELGRTTPASWAWLNANGKEPKNYQILNQLGLHVWKACKTISSLPSWMGSLVRFDAPPKFVDEGGYPNEGPLSLSRIMELEPFASWKLTQDQDGEDIHQGFTYFFPDEGCVDPLDAVKMLRKAAKDLGVVFLNKQNVSDVLRDENTGFVSGVLVAGENNETSQIQADVVIVAAGIGASAKSLGGLQLLHKPGLIAYATPNADRSPMNQLSKILVDPLRASHVLQRPDGCIVAGGGVLEVGGSTGTFEKSSNASFPLSPLDAAKELVPSILDKATYSHSSQAVRPMPKDGLPVIGYLQQGLYSIVTHSGMTLGPFLSALAAAEISENMACEILSPYRPSRFNEEESVYSSFYTN